MRKHPRWLSTALAAVTAAACVLTSAAARAAPIERVIHISVDGLAGRALADLVHGDPEAFPAFARLEAEGAYTYNARTDYGYTLTVPNHSSMITGRPVGSVTGLPGVHHGFTSNFPMGSQTLHNSGSNSGVYKAGTFDVVHDHGLGTALYTSKQRMGGFIDRSYNGTNGAIDAVGANDGRDKIDVYFNIEDDSTDVVARLRTDSAATPRAYTFLHIVEPDEIGHRDGWDSPEWDDAVAATDDRVASILDFVTTDPAYAGKTAIVLSADHGGSSAGHTDEDVPEHYTIPFFVWGPGIPAGEDLYDLITNRFDPGSSRPDYTAPEQPLRNGDSGNLALLLLGLPTIPGSFLVPELSLPTDPPAGDADGDGTVGPADAAIVLANFGISPLDVVQPSDFNEDGATDLADLLILQQSWQSSPAAGASAAVPEPAAVFIALPAMLGLLVGRGWRRR